jgi:aminoglycoside/choline kinase family phosphotransferase
MENILAEERMIALEKFVKESGWGKADLFPLKGDASFRRYTRLIMGERRALLMDAPKPHENIDVFLDMTAHLKGLGCRVANIYAEDRVQGFAILEDFGDYTFKRLLLDGDFDETALYLQAVDVLKHIHRHKDATSLDIPLYDMDALLREVNLLADWFIPQALGNELSSDQKVRFNALWQDALKDIAADHSVLVLRDYFVDNLMLADGNGALATCALLDYQDALLGSPAYDLVSLIEDARRDISPEVRRAALAHYFEGNDGIDRLKMLEAISILGAQRHAKVLGIFTRLSVRDGKHQYLDHLPRVQRLFVRSLSSPRLSELREFMYEVMPDLGNLTIEAPEPAMDSLKPPVC